MQFNNNLTNNYSISPISFAQPFELLLSSVFCFTIGSTSILANILLVVVVYKNKKLHTPCFVLIGGKSIFDSLFAAAFAIDGVQRVGVYFRILGVHYTRLECFLMSMTKPLSGCASSLLSCGISIDRLVGIRSPFTYKSIGKTIAISALSAATCLGLLKLTIAGATLPTPLNKKVLCTSLFAILHPWYAASYKTIGVLLNIGVFLSYVLIAFVIRRRRQQQSNRKKDTLFRQQLTSVPLVRTMIGVQIVFGVIPDLFALILANVARGKFLSRSLLYLGVLKSFSTLCDFLVLIAKSNEFRLTLTRLKLFQMKSTRRKSELNTRSDNKALNGDLLTVV